MVCGPTHNHSPNSSLRNCLKYKLDYFLPFLKLFKGSQLHEEQNPRCPPWLTTGTGTFLHVPLAHPIPASPVPLLFLSHYKHAPPSGPLSLTEMILTLIPACLLFLLIPGLRSCVMSSMRASLTTLPKAVIPSLRTQFVFFQLLINLLFHLSFVSFPHQTEILNILIEVQRWGP